MDSKRFRWLGDDRDPPEDRHGYWHLIIQFFAGDDLASIGTVQDFEQQPGYGLPFELTDSGTDQATTAFNTVNAADDPDAASITHTIRGDVETEQTFGIAPSLANAIETGEWDGQFRLQFDDRDAAETVETALRGGY